MHRTFSKLAIVGAAFAVIVGITVLITGQPASKLKVQPASPHRVGVPDDWTHHHLVFSNPGTYEQAVANGTYSKWINIQYDTRFILQQMKRNGTSAGGFPREMRTGGEEALSPSGMVEPQDLAIGALRQFPWKPIGPPKPVPKPKSTLKGDWSMDMGGSATVGAGMYPAKFSFSTTTANCGNATTPDYVVYNTGVAGSGTQANVVAYDNLYATTCTGTVPSVYWAYDTGTGTVATSPVLSGQGDKVAFIENPSSGAAVLRILKWVSGQGTDYNHPVAPTNSYTNTYAGAGGNTAWSSCTSGSCMISVAFQSPRGNQDTKSSPWYDYNSDKLWVGDSAGYLHEFTGVFNGTPGEMTNTSGGTCGTGCVWPVLVSSANQLTGPVYDSSTGLVFVGDTVTGAPFHSVCAVTGITTVCTTAGTVTTSGTISATGVGGMSDAPIVDSRASKAYVLINTDTTTGCLSSGSSAVPCSDVFQYATTTSIASGSQTPSKAIMGRSMGAGIPLYAGAFNDGYYSSGTGALYVCGGSPTNKSNQRPTLYKIAISGSTLTPTTGPYVAATSVGPFCSPVTEVLNGSNDYLFMSITAWAANTSCPGGCIYSYIIPTTFDLTHPPVNASLTAAGGTSGIIIDNTSTSTGASQVYFSTLSSQSCVGNGSAGIGAGGCAVQASQSALH
jgi:hypothetical protein